MPEVRKLGWYDDQTTVRLGLAEGGIKAALGGRTENVLVYYQDGEIVVRGADDPRHTP